ncbi:MAG: UDP-N-acetylmuramate dehydrogenase [Patescibacteria group bacterium]
MKIQENISLKEFTTFKIGGIARFFCTVLNEDELIEAIGFSKKNKLPFFILGGGSNILISDNGFSGIVIKMEMKGIEYTEVENGKKVQVKVGAGENWDDIVKETVEKGLYGLENLSLIPGTVGASPVQNIGAYGSEVKDTIESVYVLDVIKDEYKTITNSECRFDYRYSMFKEDPRRYVVLSVNFILQKNGKLNYDYKDLKEHFAFKNIREPSLKQVRDAVIEIRTRKLPNLKEYGTAGSFFKNVVTSTAKGKELLTKYPDMIVHAVNDKKVKIPLAWILDHICGFRGVKIGNVGTYKNQALVLVNYGGATATDITNLAQKMVDKVYEETGIEIFPEVEWVE